MTQIISTDGKASGSLAVVPTALTGADTLLIKPASTQILVLQNTGVGAATINIDGDLASTVQCRGVGSIDVSTGYDVELAAGETKTLSLGSISAYTYDAANTPAVTGGTADVLAYVIDL